MNKYILIGGVVVFLIGVSGALAVYQGFLTLPQMPIKQPSLNHEVALDDGISKEAEDAIRGKVTLNQDLLEKDITNIEAWLDLAIQYKQAGDITGAVEVWKYLDKTFPEQSTVAFNLGVVYHQDLKNYKQSEKYYRESIRRAPTLPLGYLGLHELYRYAYKTDTTAPVDVLLEGMVQIPGDVNMPIALAAYYRDDRKDYPKAIEYIQKTVAILKETQGDAQKIKALDLEAARLSALQ